MNEYIVHTNVVYIEVLVSDKSFSLYLPKLKNNLYFTYVIVSLLYIVGNKVRKHIVTLCICIYDAYFVIKCPENYVTTQAIGFYKLSNCDSTIKRDATFFLTIK